MTRMLDGCRRAASIVLVAVLLVLVPGVAMAKFTSVKAPAPLSVATGSMVTPSAIDGTYTCDRTGKSETIDVTVTRFTDGGPAGSAYDYGLAIGTRIYDLGSSTSTTRSVALSASKSDDKTVTTWIVGVQSSRLNWTSDIGTTTISCPATGRKSGTF